MPLMARLDWSLGAVPCIAATLVHQPSRVSGVDADRALGRRPSTRPTSGYRLGWCDATWVRTRLAPSGLLARDHELCRLVGGEAAGTAHVSGSGGRQQCQVERARSRGQVAAPA